MPMPVTATMPDVAAPVMIETTTARSRSWKIRSIRSRVLTRIGVGSRR